MDPIEIKVLDKGFVRLIDFMGGDETVVLAARVSTGAGLKGEEQDRKLIHYLMKHKHETPFEHSVFQFHISCPLFVARQWFRHRIACVTGDTELWFNAPARWARDRKHRVYKMPIGEFYRKWHEGARPIPHWRDPHIQLCIPMRERLQHMHVRCLNEQTNEIETTHVVDVVQSGEKDVFRVVLEDGKAIKASRDHRFYTTEGWQTLEQMVGLEMPSSGRVTIAKEAHVYTNGEPVWQSPSWLQEQVKVYRPLQKLIAKPVKVVKVEYAGREMTYDLAVCGPYHNYIANGFVVHNSYNERSGRYVEYEDEFYLPERLRLQAKSNKQASQFGEIPNEQELLRMIQETYELVYERYKKLLAAGVARELARSVLPLSLYTQFYWTINARSLMNFINLRADAGAQWEIRQYAEAIAKIFKAKMPWTWEAFVQYVWRGENPAITTI